MHNVDLLPAAHTTRQESVVQEWWGINEDIKEKALQLHQKGRCRVFIPDLYEGKVTVEIAEAKHVSQNKSCISTYKGLYTRLDRSLQLLFQAVVSDKHHLQSHTESKVRCSNCSCALQMYDTLDWPAAAERLVQAAEYLLNTGSPKVHPPSQQSGKASMRCYLLLSKNAISCIHDEF